ncbi:uncharacterized protein Z520_00314 [Fonsecaea multimorphosa CBS 102226]|uniref:Uncharacterized protein n=1 Tax=Fonsecaea multimorphosa CBS 102226 TaxID=1442371 RepID=A0A0D2KBY5_9EURO|nr:uncharacterized protein Z520_00314 [Fonsecaea multimorphosa CBS 102226]KIY03623.1 hypothetical protein Z520_00314 [Fonsecaea multimorphosa CBS 102226]OAL32324.1 hypothetical protein AYO22_00346 [Fonsecaea multimorphosa]
MGGIDVSSVVSSIISAFGNGMDIFHRLGGKRRKTNARLPRPSEEEQWLRHSLRNRPVEIKQEYDQQVARFGRQFEVGDAVAQSSLAHTLLVLNTGLINLINHALAGDPKTISLSQRTLFSLSETAAVDTMTAIGQLGSRLSLVSASRLALESKESRRSDEKSSHKERKSSSTASAKKTKRPPPAPLLVRGGWVRSRSGSSVVSGASAKKARGEQTHKHQRSKSDSMVPKSSAARSSDSRVKREESLSEVSGSTSKTTPGQVEEPKPSSRRKSSEQPRPHSQRSMLIVPADFFENAHNNHEQAVFQQPPPRPPKIPLHSRPNPAQSRVRPTSTMTFMTASTKIGEIPESRWPDKVLPEEGEGSRRMPYIIPPPLEPSEQKRRKGFKFWKREDKEDKRRDIAAY